MNLTTSLTKQARAVRAADQRLQDRRSDLDALILQGMDEGMTWTTLQQLTGLTPATLNASRRRAMRRREDRPESVAPPPRIGPAARPGPGSGWCVPSTPPRGKRPQIHPAASNLIASCSFRKSVKMMTRGLLVRTR